LRETGERPNYDSVSIREAVALLRQKDLSDTVIVDCSHANSRKQFEEQSVVWDDVIQQRLNGNDAVIGLMLESNLNEGNQKNTGNLETMQYGVSITDACISWQTTEALIFSAHQKLQELKVQAA
jgi:3-deoxy-7-phosphoheptulonate synthase